MHQTEKKIKMEKRDPIHGTCALFAIEHDCRTSGQNYPILTFFNHAMSNWYYELYIFWHVIWQDI